MLTLSVYYLEEMKRLCLCESVCVNVSVEGPYSSMLFLVQSVQSSLSRCQQRHLSSPCHSPTGAQGDAEGRRGEEKVKKKKTMMMAAMQKVIVVARAIHAD